MEESTIIPATENKPKRPTSLTVLCILTFIGSGMNLFSSLVVAGFYDLFVQIATEFAEKFKLPGLEMLTNTTPMFFLVTGIFYAGSLTGGICMMLLKKAGFHIYTISQILLVIAPMYFLHLPLPGIPELLFSGLFVFLYSMQLRFMS
ncbi:MAG: hypothetical protein WCP32_12785 [Bacteroidota bacterium]